MQPGEKRGIPCVEDVNKMQKEKRFGVCATIEMTSF